METVYIKYFTQRIHYMAPNYLATWLLKIWCRFIDLALAMCFQATAELEFSYYIFFSMSKALPCMLPACQGP